jgi:hypothetical protein
MRSPPSESFEWPSAAPCKVTRKARTANKKGVQRGSANHPDITGNMADTNPLAG